MIPPKWLRKRRQFERECERYPQRFVLGTDLALDPEKMAASMRIWERVGRRVR